MKTPTKKVEVIRINDTNAEVRMPVYPFAVGITDKNQIVATILSNN